MCTLLIFWLLGTVARSLALAPTNDPEYPFVTDTMFCANDNTPICARSRSEYLLFNNECHLRKAQRENLLGPLFDVALAFCVPGCEFECGSVYQPICGVSVNTGDLKTFRNRCEMARNSCQSKGEWLVYRSGVCPLGSTEKPQHRVFVGQPKKRQPVPCTKVYRPVCAIYSGVKSTFANECLVNAENIRTNRNWRILSEGLCGEDTTKLKHNRKYLPQSKPKLVKERTKRSSHNKNFNNIEDFEVSEDVVQIFAPSTFHTQFISNTGTMEKSYSLPARKPWVAASKQKFRRPSHSTYSNSRQSKGNDRSCVFSNEPVCGSFNGESRTFPNVCALIQYSQNVGNAWSILYEGPCRRCDFACPTIYQPICANRNGINYTIMNECYLERVRCKDPNSGWTITNKGECALPAEEVSESIISEQSNQPPSIPQMLYAANRRSNSSIATTIMTPMRNKSAPKPTATTPTTSEHLKSSTITQKPTISIDLSNRKIRKIKLHRFDSLSTAKPRITNPTSELPKIEKLEPAPFKALPLNDISLLQSTADNVTEIKNTNTKKSVHLKVPQYVRSNLTTTPKTLTDLTTVATTTTPALSSTRATELNESKKSKQDDKTNTEIHFVVGTITTVKPSEDEAITVTIKAAPTNTTTPKSPATTTVVSTTIKKPANTITKTPARSITTVITSPKSLTAVEFHTKPTPSRFKAAKAKPKTSDVSSRTSPNLDYVADEALQKPSNHMSIYGLDKNSLIMRLLRARSSLKNLVL